MTDNIIIADQTGANIFYIPGGEMGNNNFVDRNRYYKSPSSNWGLLLTTPPDPTTLTEVRTKWTNSYPTSPNNDQNSTEVTTLPLN